MVGVKRSGKDEPLLVHPPLRTVHVSFPTYGSSLTKALSRDPALDLRYGWKASSLCCRSDRITTTRTLCEVVGVRRIIWSCTGLDLNVPDDG
jgi:hypothetical protein